MKEEHKKSSCPLCGSLISSSCHKETVLDIDYSSDEFSTNVEEYRVCENCGLVYLWPRPNKADLNRYYASIPVSQTSDNVLNYYKKPEYERTAKFLLEYIGNNIRKIVEVGAASGYLLHLFRKLSKDELDVVGIEPSKACCDFARKTHDINMIQEHIEDIDIIKLGLLELADLVLCCHTLEHSINPDDFLKNMILMVKPEGFLYIEVPSTQVLSTFRNARYGRNIHHLHLNHFLSTNIISACGKYGMTLVSTIDDIGTNYPSLKVLFIKQSPGKRAITLFSQQVGMLDETYNCAQTVFTNILKSSKNQIVLWGAGQDLIYVFQRKPSIFISSRVILIDKNPQKQGMNFFGMKVINPDNVDWQQVDHILITPSSQMLQLHIIEDIKNMELDFIDYSFLFPVNE